MSFLGMQPQLLLQKACALLAARHTTEALQVLEEGTANTQGQPELLLLLLEWVLKREDANQVAALEPSLSNPQWQSDFRVLHQRGRCRQLLGDLQSATHFYEQALRAGAPQELSAAQLAVAQLAQEQWAKAEAILLPLCSVHPQRLDLRSNLSIALLRQNKLEPALKQIDAALALSPSEPSLLLNRGTVLQELGRRLEAGEAYRQALASNPALPNAHTNLGLLAYLDGDLQAAEKLYRHSLERRPHDVLAAVNLAGLLLIQGGTAAAEGWHWYERRLDGPSQLYTPPLTSAPRWQGESLSSPLLLVHEQGLGDTFQFIRFAAVLRQNGHRCLFQGPQKLHELLLQSKLVEACISENSPINQEIGAWIPMMSLAPILDAGCSPQGPNPADNTYLQADPASIGTWQKLLGPRGSLRIGLHWQGNPDHEFALSRGRSFPLSTLEPLAKIPNIEWIALQKGPGSEQIQSGPFAERWHRKQALITDTWDFQANAAILTNCDLVISSDSGLAHLAGGLGVPVWLLLPWLAEWRWGLSGRRTGWYAKHRLYRQPREGDWQAVVKAVAADLRSLASSHTG